ncbi:MAG TPA: ATP-binding protein [Acidobacteriota bacterium]|nr:ATP-binding protein [Acidobacteriota bacterium]
MSSPGVTTSRAGRVYLYLLIMPGLVVIALSFYQVVVETAFGHGDLSWLLLVALTGLGAAFPISFPSPSRHQGIILTFGDLFLYTGMLLYGPAVATIIAFTEGTVGNLRSLKRIKGYEKIVFNICQLSIATYIAAQVLYLVAGTDWPFDPDVAWSRPGVFVIALVSAAALHFTLNLGSIAIAMTLYSGQPFYVALKRGLLWTSLSAGLGAIVGALVLLKLKDATLLVILLVLLIGFINYNIIRFYQQSIEKLTRSRLFLQAIVDSISSYIAILDRSCKIMAVNREWKEFAEQHSLLGPCGQEGDRLTDFLEARAGTAHEVETSRTICEGIDKVARLELDDFELEFSSGRGHEKRWLILRIHSFEDSGELRILVEFGDQTTRKGLEEQLRHAQKMEAIGRLAGGVAHDFNNILTIISGYGAFLLESVDGDPKIRLQVETILDAADRASAVTRQLLAFSRKQVMEPRIVPLNDLVGESEKLLRRLIGEDIELISTLSPDAGSVRVDPDQFTQVLMNLVVNARDAMPDGGTVRLETWSAYVNRDSVPDAEKEFSSGEYACLRVKDTGEGMDRETLDHIFEPFFSTKESGKGTGLGLSTVYGIIKQSGGHITVNSEKGRGTSFEVYLPLMVSGQVERLPEEQGITEGPRSQVSMPQSDSPR